MDFVGCHINKVTTPVKDFCKKRSDKTPHGTAMKFHRTDHAIVCYGHLHFGVAAIMERIIARVVSFQRVRFAKLLSMGKSPSRR